ncbi:hypothetical protein KP509_18G081900 [Ceratopteris richardii]|uniref:J domain-containing protein n=1 Tax=Ceratopteris richardii TaxID=49495 RepID=A0A8T2SRA7_CERRI|nr:hypothetical protein KP509_18G081900 [Ceratopteris richardii]
MKVGGQTMGKVVQSGRLDDDGSRWAVERASERVERGDNEGALWLLQRAQRLHPASRDIEELQAVAQVCLAASRNPDCPCGATSRGFASPNWYRVLMVNETADLIAIKRKYRQLALLLHPDKNKHRRAEEAFKLVLEAYAILSDHKKREAFDALLRENGCRKCSCTAAQKWFVANKWDYKRGSRGGLSKESMKRKNQSIADFSEFSFPFDFRKADWSIKHEKFGLFRERAQEKVDSLAYVLKERRARWNEESEAIGRERYRRGDDYHQRDESWRNFHTNNLNHQQHTRETKVFSRESVGKQKSALASGIHGRQSSNAHELSRARDNSCDSANDAAEQLCQKNGKGATSGGNETPRVLEKLEGLLGMLKEELTTNNGGSQCPKSKFGEDTVTPDDDRFYTRTSEAEKGSSALSAKGRVKLEEELAVIDDFLARLTDVDEEESGSRVSETNFPLDDEINQNVRQRKQPSSFPNGGRMPNGLTTESSQEEILHTCDFKLSSLSRGKKGSKTETDCRHTSTVETAYNDDEKTMQRQKKV